MPTDSTLSLAMELIARPSVTPDDGGCQPMIAERLAAIGFTVEPMRFASVDNLWARRGSAAPLFVLAGHTDVVPTGPLDKWESDPFSPVVRNDYLYGRGAADMKSSVAAFVTAIEAFVAKHPNHAGSIGVLLTSDEEGPAVDGTVKVIEALEARGDKIDFCIVGEPSSEKTTGDTIKHGRRGSLNGRLTIWGTQGHVAYPQLAANPIHRFVPALTELLNTTWDSDNPDFPDTSFQISNIHGGTGAENVIPGQLDLVCNFRYSTSVTAQELQARVAEILARHGLEFEADWRVSGEPFLTGAGKLIEAVTAAIADVSGIETRLSTAGGTSDGRFIAPTGAEVVELGPSNDTIHKINERVATRDLEALAAMYLGVMERLLAP